MWGYIIHASFKLEGVDIAINIFQCDTVAGMPVSHVKYKVAKVFHKDMSLDLDLSLNLKHFLNFL